MSESNYSEEFMREAVSEAKKALELLEVPVGAVIVKDGCVVGRGYNLKETLCDATAHAEIIAIREASKNLGSWRLIDCDIYVTMEPCPMCASAISQARIRNIYYGIKDSTAGACGSVVNLFEDKSLYYKTKYNCVEYEECRSLLQEFFKELRKKK